MITPNETQAAPKKAPPPEHQIRRPGAKSSEFLLCLFAILAAIVPILGEQAAVAVSKTPYSVLAPAIVAGCYALGRSLVKKSRNDASGVADKGPDTVNAGTANFEAPPTPDTSATGSGAGLELGADGTDGLPVFAGERTNPNIEEVIED